MPFWIAAGAWFLLKYLSIKDGLKLRWVCNYKVYRFTSKVPVHKRWIETSVGRATKPDRKNLLKYLSIKDGLKHELQKEMEASYAPSKVPVHKRWIETRRIEQRGRVL